MGLLEASADEGARVLALRLVDQARAAADRLHDPQDAEALHDFRVALRRLRSCLLSYETILGSAVPSRLQRRLRKLARRTGPGRDAEVQLRWLREEARTLDEVEQPGSRWLEERLAARVSEAYARVREDLHARFDRVERGFRTCLASYRMDVEVGKRARPPSFAAAASAAVCEQIDALGRDLALVRSLEDEAQAHQARLHGKRLRYLLEPLRDEIPQAGDAIDRLKGLQDALGDLNDLHGLARGVGEALEEAALERARRLREAALENGAEPIDAVLRADERPGLLALLTKVQSDRNALFDNASQQWLYEGTELRALREQVEGVERVLAQHAAELPTEIERKYLLSALPPRCAEVASEELDQGYVPGEKLHERVRRTRGSNGTVYLRTVKLGQGVVRIEVEEETTEAIFESLWELTEGKRVRKRRYHVAEADCTWEIDEFLDRELVLAEIDVPSEDAVVSIPPWLAPLVVREVTHEPGFTNLSLAK